MIKPRYLITLLVMVFVCPFFGQNKAIDSLRTALAKEPSKNKKVAIYSAMGNYFFRTQVYHDSAFYYTESAYKLAKEEGLALDEARALFNMGRIHNFLKHAELAIDYYKRSMEVTKTLNEPQRLGSTYNNIGGAYFELGRYGDAIDYYEKALNISLTHGEASGIAVDYMNIAEAEYKLGDLSASKKHFELSKKQLDNIGWEPATFFLFYARTLFALEEVETARQYVDKALVISEKENDMSMISQSAELRSKIAEFEGDHKKALAYFETHTLYRDSLNTAKESNAIEKLKLNFELDRADKELIFVTKKNSYLNMIYVLVGAGLLLLLFLISRQRKIIQMTRQIHEAQNKLVGSKLHGNMDSDQDSNQEVVNG